MNTAATSLPGHLLATAATDADASVTGGREALDHWHRYPWYDASTDGVRRIDIPDPWDWSWLWDWLPDWGGNYGFSFGGFSLLQWVAWTVIVIVLALAVYLLVRAYLRGRDGFGHAAGKKTAGDDTSDAERIEALPFPVRSGRLDLLGEARRCYREGNYGQAIVYLFSFQLVQLDRQQIIRLTKGKTNRQYLREVGSRSPLHRLLQQTTVAFEDVFFGNYQLDRARFEACWSHRDEFRSPVGQGRGQT